jgi:hypothetical protein
MARREHRQARARLRELQRKAGMAEIRRVGVVLIDGEEADGTKITYLGPVIDPSWPADVRLAFEVRRETTLSGTCPVCGTREKVSDGVKDGLPAAHYLHEAGCGSDDNRLFQALGQWRLAGLN